MESHTSAGWGSRVKKERGNEITAAAPKDKRGLTFYRKCCKNGISENESEKFIDENEYADPLFPRELAPR